MLLSDSATYWCKNVSVLFMWTFQRNSNPAIFIFKTSKSCCILFWSGSMFFDAMQTFFSMTTKTTTATCFLGIARLMIPWINRCNQSMLSTWLCCLCISKCKTSFGHQSICDTWYCANSNFGICSSFALRLPQHVIRKAVSVN